MRMSATGWELPYHAALPKFWPVSAFLRTFPLYTAAVSVRKAFLTSTRDILTLATARSFLHVHSPKGYHGALKRDRATTGSCSTPRHLANYVPGMRSSLPPGYKHRLCTELEAREKYACTVIMDEEHVDTA